MSRVPSSTQSRSMYVLRSTQAIIRSFSVSKPRRHYAKGCVEERIEDGRYSVDRIVFSEEPFDKEILQFVASKYALVSETAHQTL